MLQQAQFGVAQKGRTCITEWLAPNWLKSFKQLYTWEKKSCCCTQTLISLNQCACSHIMLFSKESSWKQQPVTAKRWKWKCSSHLLAHRQVSTLLRYHQVEASFQSNTFHCKKCGLVIILLQHPTVVTKVLTIESTIHTFLVFKWCAWKLQWP